MKYLLYSITILLLSTGVVSAQSTDSFVVQTTVGTDVLSPSVPSDVQTIPVATDQIDVSWTASVDDFAVVGYQLYRDGLQIATTSLTSYSDTGLTGSTTYTYQVAAFDAIPNISVLTASSATTTLATATIPVVTSGGSGTRPTQAVDVTNLYIDVTETTATVYAITDAYTKTYVRWGRTDVYELGYSASGIYKQEHQINITDLAPGTSYEVEITFTAENGEVITQTLSFVTESGEDIVAPPNVLDLEAYYDVDLETVRLTWVNPNSDDLAGVRVMASDAFYPLAPDTGWFVYDGKAQQATDQRAVLETGRYYTVFSYDAVGNISSGAVVFVVGAVTVVQDTPSSTTTNDATFSFDELMLTQPYQYSPTLLTSDQTTVFSLPYDVVPEHLKALVVTLTRPGADAKTFSFMLRANRDKSAYEAVIGPIGAPGMYSTTISMYDYQTQTVVEVHGEIVYEPGRTVPVASVYSARYWWVWGALTLFWFWLLRRHVAARSAEDKRARDQAHGAV